jgi:hypothetical protein
MNTSDLARLDAAVTWHSCRHQPTAYAHMCLTRLHVFRAVAGVNTFDLARLEAAVAAVPDSLYAGEQRALTQFSHSLLFRYATRATL